MHQVDGSSMVPYRMGPDVAGTVTQLARLPAILPLTGSTGRRRSRSSLSPSGLCSGSTSTGWRQAIQVQIRVPAADHSTHSLLHVGVPCAPQIYIWYETAVSWFLLKNMNDNALQEHPNPNCLLRCQSKRSGTGEPARQL